MKSASPITKKATTTTSIIQGNDSNEEAEPFIPILLNEDAEQQWESMLQ